MKVICISGWAQHGKDFTANYLNEDLTSKGYNVLVTHYGDLLKFICKNMFDWNGEKDADGRRLLQYVGTDIIRAQQPDYWVDFIISILKLFEDEWDYVLIPDCRFPNELDKLKSEGFDVIHARVYRPNFDNGLTEEAKNHISETAMNDVAYDYLLVNSGDSNYINNITKFIKFLESK